MKSMTEANVRIPSLDEIKNMKVADLRKELKTLCLPITGNKSELVERLQNAHYLTKENSLLSFDASQTGRLENADDIQVLVDNPADELQIMEESASIDQDQIPSSLENDLKPLQTVEFNSNSFMPLKKRFIKTAVEEVTDKNIVLKQMNKIDFEEDKKESKLVTFTSEQNSEKVKLSLKDMSEAERLARRAEKFKTKESEIKTTANLRSLKSTNIRNVKRDTLTTSSDTNKLKARAERFGEVVSTALKEVVDKEKMLKRKMKFGVSLASEANLDDQAKKKRRAERFGML